MPVGSSNVLKPSRGRVTAPATRPTRVNLRGGVRSGASNPIGKVSLQVKLTFVEEGRQKRPARGQELRNELQGTENRVIEYQDATREIHRKEDGQGIGGGQRKLDLQHQEKALPLETPDPKYEARGRRRRVVKPQQIPCKIKGEQTCSRPTKGAEEVRERGVSGYEHVRVRTKERPIQTAADQRGRKISAGQPVAAADYLRVEKVISTLYDAKCALKRDEISSKAKFINDLVEKQIIMKICELDDRFSFDILGAGSYYEKLKVGKPNEFDIMVCLKGNNVDKCFEVQVCPIRRATPHLGGFAYLQYQSYKDTFKCWEDLLIDSPSGVGRVLSSHLIVDRFRKLISRRCQKIFQHSKGRVKCEEPTIKGPAVNVRFMSSSDVINVDIVLSIEVPTWPTNARRLGAEYRRWPSRKMIDDIQSKGCHVVPKAPNMDSRYWRLSFSLAEKSLLRTQAIDEDKKCYRIIKHIYEVNKIYLEPLCSYFLKTLFLHLRTSGFFRRGQKFSIIIGFFQELTSKIEKKKLQHFFIPDVNLFWNLTDNEARNMVSSLKRILAHFSNIRSAICFFDSLSRTSIA